MELNDKIKGKRIKKIKNEEPLKTTIVTLIPREMIISKAKDRNEKDTEND